MKICNRSSNEIVAGTVKTNVILKNIEYDMLDIPSNFSGAQASEIRGLRFQESWVQS